MSNDNFLSFSANYCSAYRGGVLEPEGTVSLQFKQRDIVQTMKRIDPLYNDLFRKNGKEEMAHEERKKRVSELRNREAYLMPSYHMVIPFWVFESLFDRSFKRQLRYHDIEMKLKIIN